MFSKESQNFRQLREKANKLEAAKLKAHKAVNCIYEDVVKEYKVWRASEEGINFLKLQLERIGYICPICSIHLSIEKATLDHLFPKRSYLHKAIDKENLLVMCYDCNQAKKATEFSEWREALPVLHRQSLDDALKLLYGEDKLKQLLAAT